MGKWACLSLTAKTVADHRHYEEVQPVDGGLYCTSNLQDETSLRPSYSVGKDVHIPHQISIMTGLSEAPYGRNSVHATSQGWFRISFAQAVR